LTGLTFLLAYAAGCLAALARHPVYGLMTYVAVFYLHPPSRWWGQSLPDLRWSLLAAAVTLVAAILHRKQVDSVRLSHHRVMVSLLIFLVWIAVQTSWAMVVDIHVELVVTFAKYLLLVGLIYKCINSVEHLRMVLWTHVAGCSYLGMLVLDQYLGGRFEGFGGPDINEANAGGLQVVTGIATAAGLFLAGRIKEKIALLGIMPVIVNALVATFSRSGFLALAVTGLMFNLLAPRKFLARVRVLSVLALVLFVMLTNPEYWMRIASIKYVGVEVEDLDTGASRLAVLESQWRMFKEHPMGCGHRCTAFLSPYYLDDKYLTGEGEERARSSHNTFMSLLVEQGIPGAVFYFALVAWIGIKILALRRSLVGDDGFLACIYPAVAGSLVAVLVGDMFVDYLKLEVRIWFLAFLMVLLKLESARKQAAAAAAGLPPAPAPNASSRRPVAQSRISAGRG
jgi:O-antigen ligase